MRTRLQRAAFAFSIGLLLFAPVPARAASWEQAETEHFLFIFEPRDRPSVDELLTFCEEVYAKVAGFFDSSPGRIPCILRGRRDDANGVTMSFPSRIDLYLTAPTNHFLGARTESWLRALLTHELTHFVHQSIDRGFLHSLSTVFGPDLSTIALDLLPGWAIEGPAVYAETRFTAGGRGRNPLFEMLSKAPAEEGNFFSLEQAGYSASVPPRGRVYVAGYALVDWLEETFGEDTFRRITDSWLDFPFAGPWAAMEKVTGVDAAALFARMRKSLVARYAPQTAIRGGTLITPERIGSWTRPQSTAQGLYAYRTRPDSYPAIVRWDAASGAEEVLIKAELTDETSFSATSDGETVWFSSLRYDASRTAEGRTTADLFALDVSTGAARKITRDAHLWHPAVSPNGADLVAVQGAGPYSRIVSVDAESGAMRVLFSRAGANVYSPVISPDGARVAFVFNLRGMQDVYVADLGALKAGALPLDDPGSTVSDVNAELPRAVLGPDPHGDYYPSFLDDTRVAFSSDRGGSLALYSADLASGAVSLIQEDPVAAIAGIVDGGSLVYASYAGTGYCLKRVPLAELLPRPIDLEGDPPRQYPPPVVWTGASVAAKPYFDTAPAYLWLPNLVASQVGPSIGDVAFGVGAVLAGGSLLGATGWSADAAWLIGSGQPVGGLALSMNFGPFGVRVSGRHSYQYAGYWAESLAGDLSLAWTAVDETALDVSRSLTLGVGLRGFAELGAGAPFTVGQSVGAPPDAWYSWLAVPLTVEYRRSVEGGRIDFNPAPALDARVQVTTYLPAFSLTAASGDLVLVAALNVPSVFAHQVLKLGIKAAQSFGAPFSQYLDGVSLPRGFPEARTRSAPGGMLASIDTLVPVALLDQPLPFGWALTALGIGLHVEALADFRISPFSFSVLPVLYAGADATVRLAFGLVSLPVGIGVAAAVNPLSPASFDPAADLRVYFFASFDSFGSSARAALESGRPQRGP